MGYEEVWKILESMVIELRRKSVTIPREVMTNLHSAKTMIQILKADPTCTETMSKIEMYLENVESSLAFIAQKELGLEHVEQWMRRLEKAREKTPFEMEPKSTVSRFVPGLPRNQHWIRVKPSEDAPREVIEKLAEQTGLSSKMQENGYLLVYGDKKLIKMFVKKMTEKFRRVK